MRNYIIAISFSLITSFFLHLHPDAAAQPVTAETAQDDALESFVDGIVVSAMEDDRIPGLTIAIVHNGSVRLLKGYGFADLEKKVPVDPNQHLFRIGSAGKTMTFTALMQLVEEGSVSLDADVNDYLTAFKIPDAFNQPIRVRDLMAHRPGFEEVYRGLFAASANDYESLELWLEKNIPSRVFAPGEITSYSNFGAALAGYIVEEVSGIPFEDYLQNQIFTPLDMHSTTARQPWDANKTSSMSPELFERLASVYAWDGSVLQRREFEFIVATPAGSVSSTAADMANYMLAHLNEGELNGQRILARGTAQSMRARTYNDRQSADFAHGFRTGHIGRFKTFEHGGTTQTSYTSMLMTPAINAGVFISTNGGNNTLASQNAARRITALLAGVTEADEPPRVEMSNAALAMFSGAYMTTRREYSGFLKLTSAFSGTSSVSVSPNDTLIVSSGSNSAEYAPISDKTFRNITTGETISFSLDEDGRPLFFSSEYGHATNFRVKPSENPQALFTTIGATALLALMQILSAWKRRSESKPEDIWTARLHLLSFVTALGILTVLGLLILVITQMTALGNGFLHAWPFSSAIVLSISIAGLLVLGALMVAGLAPAFTTRTFSLWRKAHYLVFTVAVMFFLLQLNTWNLVGFKYW